MSYDEEESLQDYEESYFPELIEEFKREHYDTWDDFVIEEYDSFLEREEITDDYNESFCSWAKEQQEDLEIRFVDDVVDEEWRAFVFEKWEQHETGRADYVQDMNEARN